MRMEEHNELDLFKDKSIFYNIVTKYYFIEII